MSSIFSRIINLAGSYITGILPLANGGWGPGDTTNNPVVLVSQSVLGVAQTPVWNDRTPFDATTTAITNSGSSNGSPSAITTNISPSWVTAAQSGGGNTVNTGTTTLTFSRVGYYRVTIHLKLEAGTGAPTMEMQNTWGGTATIFNPDSVASDSCGYVTANDNQDLEFSRIVTVTAVGQTVTLNAHFNLTTGAGWKFSTQVTAIGL
jgi:hypothetical protein